MQVLNAGAFGTTSRNLDAHHDGPPGPASTFSGKEWGGASTPVRARREGGRFELTGTNTLKGKIRVLGA